jgi:tRNA pseudouridine13 synthase
VEDISKLMTYLSEKVAEELLAFYNKILASPSAKPRDHGFVTSVIPAEKAVRTALHEDIRRIFNSKIESSTDKDKDLMTFSAAVPRKNVPSKQRNYQGKQVRGQGKLGWAERGGEYLHFTIYKENKDTMEVISYLGRQLQLNAKSFQFAGTKDRRAVTVQRASAYRVEGQRLSYQNRTLRNASVGDFEYQKRGLELGDLKGNEFVITLRECQLEHAQNLPMKEKVSALEKAVFEACQNLHQRGFFNYYGLQRFGTFSTRTDEVGIKILQGDFQGACEAILHYSPNVLAAAQDVRSSEQISSDDKARAEAIHVFQETGRLKEALDKLPRKFSAEGNIIRHLAKSQRDYFGAIQMIQRNLKLMYVHAYQSLVWNSAVGERWKLFGDRVVEGDLVLVDEHKGKETAAGPTSEEVDADGEIIVQPAGEDRAQAIDDQFERARVLTADEAASGEYNIFDIVLPLPGYDVFYPENAMMDFYKDFMSSARGGGLDPFDMRRKQKEFSLSGGYRKIIARIEGGYDVQVRAYRDDNEQFVQTDMEVIKGGSSGQQAHDAANEDQGGDKLAVILKMQLGSSQYATMALRELSKSGIQQYKPDIGGGR